MKNRILKTKNALLEQDRSYHPLRWIAEHFFQDQRKIRHPQLLAMLL